MTSDALTESPLIAGTASQECRAIVTIPARNEEAALPRCLDALARQQVLCGAPLSKCAFEVLVLLNNCTDATSKVAGRWKAEHPEVALHVAERWFPQEQAHAGTARRLLMDTACARLRRSRREPKAILATDADTVVAPDWIAQNMRALEKGADVVGGRVEVLPEELAVLPSAVLHCYEQDRRYACLVAQLEHCLDSRPGDSWPRHLDHFGSSLACTPRAYRLAGGMPALSPLEDEAFIDAVRGADLILRHDPAVKVYTSARMEGRAKVGLAGQLRLWRSLPGNDAHRVASAAFLEFRFRLMRRLRQIYESKDLGDLRLPTPWWEDTFAEALATQATCPAFLGAVYCNILISESFEGEREEPVAQAIRALQERLARSVDLPG